MMEMEKSDAWQRQQLAAAERMQRDLARLTYPGIRMAGTCGVAYLASWAAVLALGAPAFALAVGVERNVRGRSEKV